MHSQPCYNLSGRRLADSDTVSPMSSKMPAPNTDSLVAELLVITDMIDRQRDRVASLAEPFLGTSREDVVTALHEAERQILMSSRALKRTLKSLGS